MSWCGPILSSPLGPLEVDHKPFWQGPITEEVVFRACFLAVYHMAGVSRKKMIFLSPLAFGVGKLAHLLAGLSGSFVAMCAHMSIQPQAHLHHAWDTYNRYGRTTSALRIATLQTCRSSAHRSQRRDTLIV